MGVNASSNEWCCNSDVIIRGLPWAGKIVDDSLIWAETETELLDRARIVLTRCKENNITISLKKLELNNKIKFTGHIISDEGYGPDNEKYWRRNEHNNQISITSLLYLPFSLSVID